MVTAPSHKSTFMQITSIDCFRFIRLQSHVIVRSIHECITADGLLRKKDLRYMQVENETNNTYTRLIMISGGIDSTHALTHALRETNDTIVAHHVHMINAEGRHEAESVACNNVVNFCRRNFRDFHYTESSIDRSNLRAFGFDVLTIAAEAGIASSNHYLIHGKMPDYWTLGINQEEFDLQHDLNSRPPQAHETSLSRLHYILAAISASCYPNLPPKYLRPKIRPKAELIDYLGKSLSGLCWTCRRPVMTIGGPKPCGECDTCKLMAQI